MKKLTDDERINAQINFIYANAFKILIIGMILDVMYKVFFKKENFTDIMDINILFLISFTYIIIMFVKRGLFNIKINSGKSNKFYVLGTSLISSIIFTVAMNLYKNINFERIILMWITFFGVMYIILSVFTKISNKKN